MNQTALTASLSFSPASVVFSTPIAAGSHSDASTVTVTNTGSIAVSIGEDAINTGTAGPADFSIVPGSDGCYNHVLSPDGGSCTLSLAFTPGLNAPAGPVEQTLSFQTDSASGGNIPASVPLSGTVKAVSETISWGYCIGENVGGAYGVVHQDYTVCMLENRDSPTSLVIFGFTNSQNLASLPPIAKNAPQLIDSINNTLTSGYVTGSLAIYAVAFDAPANERLESQEYVTANAGGSADIGEILTLGKIGGSAGIGITLMQSADQNIAGFMYGLNIGACTLCLHLPISVQVSENTIDPTVDVITFPSGVNPVEGLEVNLLAQCVAGNEAACLLAAAPVLAPAAAAWVRAPYTGSSAVPGETNFDYWARAAGVQTAAVSGSTATLTETCPRGTRGRCTGTVTLEARLTSSGAVVADPKQNSTNRRTRLVILGRTHFNGRARRRLRVYVQLTGAGRRLLKHRRVVMVTEVTVTRHARGRTRIRVARIELRRGDSPAG